MHSVSCLLLLVLLDKSGWGVCCWRWFQLLGGLFGVNCSSRGTQDEECMMMVYAWVRFASRWGKSFASKEREVGYEGTLWHEYSGIRDVRLVYIPVG